MAGSKPWSWKVRIALVIVALFISSIIFLLTPWGFGVMKGHLDQVYDECPANERARHWSADWFLGLAWWEGTICRRFDEAKAMYLEFVGILPTKGQSFRDTFALGRPEWNGKYDGKTKTGWGPTHPRAPEAYCNYLELDRPYTSAQMTSLDAAFYKILFFDLYAQLTKSPRPHPKFYVYWERVERMIDPRFTAALRAYRKPPPKPPDYEGPPKGFGR
jgi:hypothetical protein